MATATERIYSHALRMLESELGVSGAAQLVERAAEVVAHLEKKYANFSTRKVKLSAVIRVVREAGMAVPLPYARAMADMAEATLVASKQQKLSDGRKDSMLDWAAIRGLRGLAKEKLSAEDYLIYCLYTLQAPVRADYTGMRVLTRFGQFHSADTTRNYCVLTASQPYFVFNVYKTAKTYGQVMVPICAELAVLIREMGREGQDLLTLTTPNALTKRVMAIFETLTEKPKLGIGLLRHSYITTFLATFKTIKKKEEMARRMLHSRAVQETYAVAEALEDADEVEVAA
jgi:hypothetical protein